MVFCCPHPHTPEIELWVALSFLAVSILTRNKHEASLSEPVCVLEFSFVMRPPSLIAAASICSAVSGVTDQMCNGIVQELHRITAIDEV